MSILHDHFEKVRQMEAQGIPITRGVFYDVGGTLVTFNANQPLIDFAKWNDERKYLGDNHVFSGDINHAREMLNEYNVDTASFGVEELVYKQRTFNEALARQHDDNVALSKLLPEAGRTGFIARPSHSLELIIDDSAPLLEGIMDAGLVVTWWDPRDPKVREFLEQKHYLDFKP